MTSNLSGEELNILSGIESELAFTLDTYNRDIILELGKIAVGAMESEIYDSFNKNVRFELKDIGVTKIGKIKDNIYENVILTKNNIYIEEDKQSYMMLTSENEEEFFKIFKMDNAIDKYESLKKCWSEVASSAIEASYILLEINEEALELNSELLVKNEINIEPIDDKNELVCVSYDLILDEEKLNMDFSILLTIEAASFLAAKMSSLKDTDEFPEEVLREISYDHDEEDDDKDNDEMDNRENEDTIGLAQFPNLVKSKGKKHDNINLILDVPLEISAVLGRSKKTIRDILEFTNGSLIELNKLAEEPIEILVNGKKIALGEVVVLDENLGVRITDIVSNVDRVKSLR